MPSASAWPSSTSCAAASGAAPTPASACCCTRTGLNDTARARLTLLRDTEDGFLIADEDFRLRGGGEATRHAAVRPSRLSSGRCAGRG